MRSLGSAWTQLFPQLKAITAHPDWPPFEAEVLARHEEGARLLDNSLRCSASGPEALAGLQRDLEQLRQAQLSSAQLTAQLTAQLSAHSSQLTCAMKEQECRLQATLVGVLEQHLNPLGRKRVLDSDLNLPQQASAKRACTVSSSPSPPPEPRTPPQAAELAEAAPATQTEESGAAASDAPAGLTFRMVEFADVRAAWEAYCTIESKTEKGKRKWQGNKKEIKRHSNAFGNFQKGLAAQIEARGLEALEKEAAVHFPPGRNTSLQSQTRHYIDLFYKSQK